MFPAPRPPVTVLSAALVGLVAALAACTGEPVAEEEPPPEDPFDEEPDRDVAPARHGLPGGRPGFAPEEDDGVSPDDPDVVEAGLVGGPVIERVLGGRRVDEGAS